jgi:hypothetical protein
MVASCYFEEYRKPNIKVKINCETNFENEGHNCKNHTVSGEDNGALVIGQQWEVLVGAMQYSVIGRL